MVDPVAAALPPVAPDDPCGPDLDLAGDSEFMNYLAASEGQMPSSFFSFDRKSIDFPSAIEKGEQLLARTHDLRLITQLAKLNALNRDLAGFARWVETIAWLLETRWEEVHPRAEEGDYSQRLAQLGTLNDGPVCILPLQYAPLIETRRDGAIVFRAQMVVLGEVKLREGEPLATAGAIDRILATVELEALKSTHDVAESLRNALRRIRAVLVERVGFEQAVEFEALASLIDRIANFLHAALAHRDPTLAAPSTEADEAAASSQTPRDPGAPASSPASLETFEDIDAALGAALGYFAQREPSSPALLLIAQAREALGKNLYDVMKLLAPAHADAARVFVGPEGAFTVPVSSLSSASPLEFSRASPEPAATRAAALGLIDAVAAQMRRVEPSSPLPYLLERGRVLASRDFLSLLHEVLPEDNLNSMKEGR